MSEHTPGPWKVEPQLDGEIPISGHSWGSYLEIADIHLGGFEQVDSEAEANARLIAAAPELLEAIKAYEKEHHFNAIQGKPHSSSKEASAWVRVRAAIAKAEGK